MKLKILLCDRFPGLLPDYIPSYEAMFVRLFAAVVAPLSYEVYYVPDGELPDLPAEATTGGDATEDDEPTVHLITGCNLSVYDDVAWIRPLLDWIRRAHRAGRNIVGICFGHQAVAEALGGHVERAAVGWGIGIRTSSLEGEEIAAYFPDGTMHLLYNHHDQVVAVPPRATVFARSAFCPVEGMLIGDNIVTLQGHPEYVSEYAVHLIMNFADDEPLPVRIAALRSIGAKQHDGRRVTAFIVDRFNKKHQYCPK